MEKKLEKLIAKLDNAIFPDCVCGGCSKYAVSCKEAQIEHVDLTLGEFNKLINDIWKTAEKIGYKKGMEDAY